MSLFNSSVGVALPPLQESDEVWFTDVQLGHHFDHVPSPLTEPLDFDEHKQVFVDDPKPSTFPDLLRVSGQLAAFTKLSQYAEFFNKILTHKSMDGLETL